MIRRPPRSPLFPSTTLSRSHGLSAIGRDAVSLTGFVDAPPHRGPEIGRDVDLEAELAAEAHAEKPHGHAADVPGRDAHVRSEEHTSELQSQSNLVCRLLLEK